MCHNWVSCYHRFEGVYTWIHPSLLGARSIMTTKAIFVQRGSRHWSLGRKQTLRYRSWRSARARYSCASLSPQRHRRRRRAFARPDKYTNQHSQDEVSVSSIIRPKRRYLASAWGAEILNFEVVGRWCCAIKSDFIMHQEQEPMLLLLRTTWRI